MKRLHVTPRCRRRGNGRLLSVRLLDDARTAGYRRMLLDTGGCLAPALALYRGLGFRSEPGYHLGGTVYMARDL